VELILQDLAHHSCLIPLILCRPSTVIHPHGSIAICGDLNHAALDDLLVQLLYLTSTNIVICGGKTHITICYTYISVDSPIWQHACRMGSLNIHFLLLAHRCYFNVYCLIIKYYLSMYSKV